MVGLTTESTSIYVKFPNIDVTYFVLLECLGPLKNWMWQPYIILNVSNCIYDCSNHTFSFRVIKCNTTELLITVAT